MNLNTYYEGTAYERGERFIACVFNEYDPKRDETKPLHVEVMFLKDGSLKHFNSMREFDDFRWESTLIDEEDYRVMGVMAKLSNELYTRYRRSKEHEHKELRQVLINTLRTSLDAIDPYKGVYSG